MSPIRTAAIRRGTGVIVGLFLIFLIQGCITTEVTVKCGSGAMEDDGIGACRPNGPATGMWPEKCTYGNCTAACGSGGSTCQSPPGYGPNGKICKRVATAPGSICNCTHNY